MQIWTSYLFIPYIRNKITVDAQTCQAGDGEIVQSNIFGTYSIVIGTILIQNERQGNGSCKWSVFTFQPDDSNDKPLEYEIWYRYRP